MFLGGCGIEHSVEIFVSFFPVFVFVLCMCFCIIMFWFRQILKEKKNSTIAPTIFFSYTNKMQFSVGCINWQQSLKLQCCFFPVFYTQCACHAKETHVFFTASRHFRTTPLGYLAGLFQWYKALLCFCEVEKKRPNLSDLDVKRKMMSWAKQPQTYVHRPSQFPIRQLATQTSSQETKQFCGQHTYPRSGQPGVRCVHS